MSAQRSLRTSEKSRVSVPVLALSPDDAAASLSVGRTYFDSYVAPELRWVRRGRRKFVRVVELERWLAANEALTLGDQR